MALIEKPSDSIDHQRVKVIPILPVAALENARSLPAVRARRERIAERKARREAERNGAAEASGSGT